VYQVGNNKKVILWCTANQISRFDRKEFFTSFFSRHAAWDRGTYLNLTSLWVDLKWTVVFVKVGVPFPCLEPNTDYLARNHSQLWLGNSRSSLFIQVHSCTTQFSWRCHDVCHSRSLASKACS